MAELTALVDIRPIAADQIESARQLLLAAGWVRCVVDADEFTELVGRSPIALVAVQGGQVVGFLRAITDGMTNGYLSMLVVHEAHRSKGIGRLLMRAAMGDDTRMTWVLRAAPNGVSAFYEALGFRVSTVAMERPGRVPPSTPA